MSNQKDKTSLIEAVLLIESTPVTLEELASIVSSTEFELKETLKELKERLDEDERSGITVLEEKDCYSLKPKETLQPLLENYYKKEESLSKTASEILAIIAYSQPVTRLEIENLRGVPADSMIRQLLKKGLICKMGKKEIPGRPTQYGTTPFFLELFHLKSIEELPRLEEKERERFAYGEDEE